MKKLHVSLPPDVHQLLKLAATKDGMTMTKWVTRALRTRLTPTRRRP